MLSGEHINRFDKFLSKVRSDVYSEVVTDEKWDYLNTNRLITVIKMFRLVVGSLEGKKLLVVGFGGGHELDIFREEGSILVGINLFQPDLDVIRNKGHEVLLMDQSFMDFDPGTFDIIWSSHCLEHSFMPYYTLHEYNRVAKIGAYLYIEVPSADTTNEHQENPSHYSLLPKSMWLSLMRRSGFTVIDKASIKLAVLAKNGGTDIYYSFILRKDREV